VRQAHAAHRHQVSDLAEVVDALSQLSQRDRDAHALSLLSRRLAVILMPRRSRRDTVRPVEVTFTKLVEKRAATWEAVRAKRTRVPGTAMALGRGDLPHDLVQIIVEATLGLEKGFWGSVASGATFKSTGRKRTRPGRAVIAANRAAIAEAEGIVGEHHGRWRTGAPTPTAARFDELSRLWDGLGDGGQLRVEWPSLRVLGGA